MWALLFLMQWDSTRLLVLWDSPDQHSHAC